MINTQEDYKAVGPAYTAEHLHSKGFGVESNPFPYDTADHMEFIVEMNKLEAEERQEADRV